MAQQGLAGEIEVYEIGARRLYVKNGARSIAISEDDLTPEELVGIAGDIAARQARRLEPEFEMAAFQIVASGGHGERNGRLVAGG